MAKKQKHRPPKTHEVKSHPEQFTAMVMGLKPWEVRKNDRDYRMGDILAISEWDPAKGQFTGFSVLGKITYMLQGKFGLPEDVCVLSLDIFGKNKCPTPVVAGPAKKTPANHVYEG